MQTGTTEPTGQPAAPDLDRPVRLHPLRYAVDGEDVTVGRTDVDLYCVLPADGAALLRELGNGVPPRQAAAWYERTYGESVDMADFLAGLDEFGFTAPAGAATAATEERVRWQRLGKAVFSRPAWLLYAAVVLAAVVVAARHPDLRPHYRNLFFTRYVSVVELAIVVGQIPFILFHESWHALAGRRLGLRSRLGLGRRLNYVVFETSMDGLVMVPRRQRYLPLLVGMAADLLVAAALTLVASATRTADGALPTAGRVCLALAFATLLRFSWQFYFYLRTDLHQVISTVLGCVDLHGASWDALRRRFRKALGRPLGPEPDWHPRDRAAARWYSWLILLGYTFSIAMIVTVAVPTLVRMVRAAAAQVSSASAGSTAALADAVVFVGLNGIELAIVLTLVVRDRRRRRAVPSRPASRTEGAS